MYSNTKILIQEFEYFAPKTLEETLDLLYKYKDRKTIKILDLGCGNGRLFSMLKDKNVKYVGIDSSDELIKIAKDRYQGENLKFLVVEALMLPFPDNSFNKIFSVAVLHHLPSDDIRLESLKQQQRVRCSRT